MKKLFTVLGLASVLMFFTNQAAAIAITIDPSDPAKVQPGTNISFDINISGLHETLPSGNQVDSLLAAFSLDFLYNPQLLSFSTSMGGWGGYLGDVTAGETVGFGDYTSTLGVISIGQVSLLEESASTCTFCIGPYLADLQTDPVTGAYLDSFTLVTLGFYVPYGGNPGAPNWPAGWPSTSAVFDTANVVLSDPSGNAIQLLDAAGNPIGIAPIGTPSIIVPVPEPATIALMVLGLVGIGFFRANRTGFSSSSPT